MVVVSMIEVEELNRAKNSENYESIPDQRWNILCGEKRDQVNAQKFEKKKSKVVRSTISDIGQQ